MKKKYKTTIIAALLSFIMITNIGVLAFAKPHEQALEQIIQKSDSKTEANMDELTFQIYTSDRRNLVLGTKKSKEKFTDVIEKIEKDCKDLKKNKDDIERQIKESEAEKEKILKYIQENSELSIIDADIIVFLMLHSDISDKAKSLIEEAIKYLKVPYLWGGESPKGFDCSGLMKYVFHKQGINIPRMSQEQQHVATTISISEIKPGDLVFNKASGATHVGMYIGNDMYIQSPRTGDVTKISKLSTSNMKYAGRILN